MSELFPIEESSVEVVFEQEQLESSEEPPQEDWSSLLCFNARPLENEKRRLYAEGLYMPPSETICAKYLAISDSSIYKHPLYPYPAVINPGVQKAILEPIHATVYSDDGQELYLAICKDMNESYCRLFHRQLLTERMDLSYYGISTYGYRAMALALRRNRIVRSINLTSNFINEDGCYHFGELLRDNITITEMNFESCNMGAYGVLRLVANLHRNLSLRKINLSKNRLTDQGFEYLAKSIYRGARVADINVSHNKLTTKSALFLAEALEHISNLSHLDLSWNSLTVPRQLEKLFTQLLQCESLVEINLAWNALTARFTKAICTLLCCPNIKVINLSNNTLVGKFFNDVADTLFRATKLVTLDLSYNPMTPDDAKVMLTSLKTRKVKLKNLLMDGIQVAEDFVKLKDQILKLRFRKDCKITHGYVLSKVIVTLTDMRDIVMRRAQILCNKPKKKRANVGLILLKINRETNGQPLPGKELLRALKDMGAFQLNDVIVEGMVNAFPGPRVNNLRTANVAALADYVHRKSPEIELPPPSPPPPPPPPPPPKTPAKAASPEKIKKKPPLKKK